MKKIRCFLLGHKWGQIWGDANMRRRECLYCGKVEESLFMQPWRAL